VTVSGTGAEARIRVAVLQPNLRNYRAPVFRALAARPGITLTVLFGSDAEGLNVTPEGFEAAPGPLREFRVFGQSFYWQADELRWADPERCDVIVLPWNVRYLSLAPAMLRARRRGVGTVLWGHAYSKSESRLRRWARNRVAALADAQLFYNRTARDALVASGWSPDRLFVALNSLDQSAIQRERARWLGGDRLARFKTEHGLQADRNVIFVSRLYPENRVDLLLDAAARLRKREPALRVTIVGDGPARTALESQARSLGLGDTVIFTGAVFGEPDLAPWFLASQIFCYPANIGLSILHAFGYGLPVVTGDRIKAHNPEIEALRPGVNGQLFRDGDAASLAEALGRLLGDETRRRALGEGAHWTATEEFTIERMVDGFEGAIRFAVGQS